MLQVLLAEEPRRELSSELRLQAVAAITSLRYCPTPGWPHSIHMAPDCLYGPTVSEWPHTACMAPQPPGTIVAVLGCCSPPLEAEGVLQHCWASALTLTIT